MSTGIESVGQPPSLPPGVVPATLLGGWLTPALVIGLGGLLLRQMHHQYHQIDKRVDQTHKRIDHVESEIKDLRREMREEVGEIRSLVIQILTRQSTPQKSEEP